MKNQYFEMIMLIERLHRLFLEVVKAELDQKGIVDINNVQSLILYNIGPNKMSVGEVSNRGFYLGSNVTYNLKKLVENEYLIQEQSAHDKRSSHVKLSKKGLAFYEKMNDMIDRHLVNMERNGIKEEQLKSMFKIMQQLESFWSFISIRDLRY